MPQICSIALDDASIIRRTPEVEHERRVAMADLVEENEFALKTAGIGHPYHLFISVKDNRLLLRLNHAEAAEANHDITLPLSPFRRIIKDYFLMCEGYFEAIKTATPDRIQTLDMARRSVHNEGSELLNSLLDTEVAMDFNTARRLFTLICVLHVK
jgi:uncharacterized protein (UPF0262 family)